MKEVVDLDPPYQRERNVWKPAARSALIDSIINGFDVPKLYFETATTRKVGPTGLTYQYAVIDGKQRLETILAFRYGELPLPEGDQEYGRPANVRLPECKGLVQSTNDGIAKSLRVEILQYSAFGYRGEDLLAGFKAIADGDLPTQDETGVILFA